MLTKYHIKLLSNTHKIVVGFIKCNMTIIDNNVIVKIKSKQKSQLKIIPKFKIEDNNKLYPAINIHSWIKLNNNEIIDPSLDMFKLKTKQYYETISELFKSIEYKLSENERQVIKHYINFSKNVKTFKESKCVNKDNYYYYDFFKDKLKTYI